MQYHTDLRKYLSSRLSRQVKGKQIDFIYLSDHDDINLDLIKEYKDALWDWESLQIHPKFSLEWLISFPDAAWDWPTMHYSEKFDDAWLVYFCHKPWSWDTLHNSEKFKFKWLEMVPNAAWDWNRISERATIDIINKCPQLPWMWDIVTAYSDISAKTMMENLHLPWDVSLIRFDDITMDEIGFLRHFKNRFPNGAWIDFTQCAEWSVITKNADLDWVPQYFTFTPNEFVDGDENFLLRYPIEQLNWVRLSLNVPFHIIKKNLDLPWMFEWVSANESITWKDIEEFPDLNWDWAVVPCEPIEISFLRWVSASKLKRAWRNAISNPEYKMCRDRIERERVEFTKVVSDLYELAPKHSQDRDTESQDS